MRLLIPVLALALYGAASCQWAGDSKAAKIPFAQLRQQLDDVNTRLNSAVENGSYDRVASLDRELNQTFDTIQGQSSAINLLDREHLAINVATARRCLTDMDRYAQSGDAGLLQAQLQQLKPTIAEIDELLVRAERTTTTN